jgi:hypothetical protein
VRLGGWVVGLVTVSKIANFFLGGNDGQKKNFLGWERRTEIPRVAENRNWRGLLQCPYRLSAFSGGTTPFAQLLPHDPFDHPPHRRRSPATPQPTRDVDIKHPRRRRSSSPNHIVRGEGRTKEGKQVKLTARGAQGRRPRKRSFSRDDRLARDGACMHTGSSNSLSSMLLSPPPALVANNDRFMLPTARVLG